MSRGGAEHLWAPATEILRTDPAFGPIVERAGPVPFPPRRGTHFEVLCRTIVYQQLAAKAAETIHGRFVTALGECVTPETVSDAADDDLRGAGLSRNKLAAIRDLAEKAACGEVELAALDTLEDEAIIERLVQVRGIGRWSAEMFLIFRLFRPDVWPVTDLGVRKGWALAHGLAELPAPKELATLGEPYRPWRSAVAWYCYRAVELIPSPTS